MSAKTIIIRKLSRTPATEATDTLDFKPGVNLIVGEKDSGKTKWLSMLNYLMADPDKPEDVFGDELSKKYDSVRAEIEIAGEHIILERRWKEEGEKTKVRINDTSCNASDFSEFLLKKLNIPMLNFPKGNPWAERAWSPITWRMLLRHIYRQERFWTDFADKQPPGEQHACVAQFLGAAVALFPPKLGELIQKQKELEAIQAQKDAHIAMLNSITAELMHHAEMTVGVTEASLDEAQARLKTRLQELDRRRTQLLRDMDMQVKTKVNAESEMRRQALQRLVGEKDGITHERSKLAQRESELRAYWEVLKGELERLGRAKASGQIFADLKVTHCPACDQEIDSNRAEPGICFLCRRPLPQSDTSAASRRLAFEEDQLSDESAELEQLLNTIRTELANLDQKLQRVTEPIVRLESELSAARKAAATLIPEDLVLIDRDSGRINEQLGFLNRVRHALEIQKDLSGKIDECQKEETRLKAELTAQTPDVNLEDTSHLFQDRMVDYLNKLNIGDANRWTYGPITFRLRQRDFQVRVRDGKWNAQVGATSQALVLFAYHYAMLSLVTDGRFNYPGLVIIDFPLELADGASVADKENYLVEPFIELCARQNFSTFSLEEIKDLPGIINRFRNQSDAVSALLWKGLTMAEQDILVKLPPSEPTPTTAQDIILHALNKIVVGPSIFESERFKGISLRSDTTDLIKKIPTGPQLTHLNRLLLEDAYPLKLSRNPKKGMEATQFIAAGRAFENLPGSHQIPLTRT
jgi:energy-coupling factor transporter ATP-binding protein EcfA2